VVRRRGLLSCPSPVLCSPIDCFFVAAQDETLPIGTHKLFLAHYTAFPLCFRQRDRPNHKQK